MKVTLTSGYLERKSSFQSHAIATDPLESGPNKGPPDRCLTHQYNETEFGSEAKESVILRSKNGEFRAPALESTTLPDRPASGLLYRILTGRQSSLRWTQFSRGGRSCAAHAQITVPGGRSLSAHGPPPPSWIGVLCAVLLRAAAKVSGTVFLCWEC